MKSSNNRKVVVYDIETTGIDTNSDEIVQFYAMEVNEKTGKEKSRLHLFIKPSKPIPNEVSEIHGIYDKDVKNSPSFKEVAQEIFDFLNNSILVQYNGNRFDNKIVKRQLKECGFPEIDILSYDALTIYKRDSSRKLEDAVLFYTGERPDPHKLHDASYDVEMTWLVAVNQSVKRGKSLIDIFEEELKPDLKENKKFIKKDGCFYINFGKHHGSKISNVPKDYLVWIVNKSDMDQETKDFVKKYI